MRGERRELPWRTSLTAKPANGVCWRWRSRSLSDTTRIARMISRSRSCGRGAFLLRYRLKPMHNVYELKTILPPGYPTLPPETHVVTPLKPCPHLLEGQLLCMWRQGSTLADEPLGPREVHVRLRRAGRVALARLLRNLARDRRLAPARSAGEFPSLALQACVQPRYKSEARRRITAIFAVSSTWSIPLPHLFQVGAGSGGMTVLDIVCRDPRITHVTLIEPDIYKPHNVERHLFPLSAVGRQARPSWPASGSKNDGRS